MKSLIDINSWRSGHIDGKPNASDFYYVKLARRLYDVIRFTLVGRDEEEYVCARCAMSVAYYFEDVVSGVGVWQAFTSRHKELYGKYLPFYDYNEEEYYQDEINFEDVCFLLWMLLQQERSKTFLNPENPYLMMMAYSVYNELDGEFEKAPMNVEMVERLKNKSFYEDFFSLKALLISMVESLYLLEPFLDVREDRVEKEVEAIVGDNVDNLSFAYAVNSLVACCEKTGPLALYAKDWLASMLAYWGMEQESERVAAIESSGFAVYQLKSYDPQTICLENIEGKEYIVPRHSFNELRDSTLLNNKSFIGSLVKYDGEWQANGLSTWSGGTALFEAYKEERMKAKGDSVIYDKGIKANNNHPLLYFQGHEEMVEWLKRNIGLDEEFAMPDDLKKQRYFALYFDKGKAMSILPDAALVIKDEEHNPYYSKEEAEKKGIDFIVSDAVTTKEMAHYLIEHRMLPDACINSTQGLERGKQLVQENMDFIARFMRTDGY